jgi:hypothetical protein
LSDLGAKLISRYRLAKVETIKWRGSDGREWEGLLYYPVDFSPSRRFPLVIQTHGFSKSAFSLSGNDSFPNVFAAQALANLDIAVLQLGNPAGSFGIDDWWLTPREPEVFVEGVEGGVHHLEELGIVDSQRVGFTGFSRTGWYVEYALTHSSFRYAAAIDSDSIDNSYVQSAMRGWVASADSFNGATSFGPGLKFWLENAPGFLADRIRTPIRLQISESGRGYVLSKWEMFGRLRSLKLPVELYVIPDCERGSHILQNPRQLMASIGGAVDWYNFWLNGRLSENRDKESQNQRWIALRRERDSAIATPRPPLLEWSSSVLLPNGRQH